MPLIRLRALTELARVRSRSATSPVSARCSASSARSGPATVARPVGALRGEPAGVHPAAYGVVADGQDLRGFRDSVGDHAGEYAAPAVIEVSRWIDPLLRYLHRAPSGCAGYRGAGRMEPVSAQGQPSRYTRSFGGMIGALIVTVLFVLAFVAWRGLFRSDVDDTPVAVDWRESVRARRSRRTCRSCTRASCRPGGPPRAWTCPPATTRGGASGCSPTTATSSASASRTRRSTTSCELYVDEEADAGDDASVAVRRSPTPGRPGPTTAGTTATPPRSATRRCWSTAPRRSRTSRPTSGCSTR